MAGEKELKYIEKKSKHLWYWKFLEFSINKIRTYDQPVTPRQVAKEIAECEVFSSSLPNEQNVLDVIQSLSSIAHDLLDDAKGVFEELESNNELKKATYKVSAVAAASDIRPAAIILTNLFDFLEIEDEGETLQPKLVYKEIRTATGPVQLTSERILKAAREANAIVEPVNNL
jgi:hypothetical protein